MVKLTHLTRDKYARTKTSRIECVRRAKSDWLVDGRPPVPKVMSTDVETYTELIEVGELIDDNTIDHLPHPDIVGNSANLSYNNILAFGPGVKVVSESPTHLHIVTYTPPKKCPIVLRRHHGLSLNVDYKNIPETSRSPLIKTAIQAGMPVSQLLDASPQKTNNYDDVEEVPLLPYTYRTLGIVSHSWEVAANYSFEDRISATLLMPPLIFVNSFVKRAKRSFGDQYGFAPHGFTRFSYDAALHVFTAKEPVTKDSLLFVPPIPGLSITGRSLFLLPAGVSHCVLAENLCRAKQIKESATSLLIDQSLHAMRGFFASDFIIENSLEALRLPGAYKDHPIFDTIESWLTHTEKSPQNIIDAEFLPVFRDDMSKTQLTLGELISI